MLIALSGLLMMSGTCWSGEGQLAPRQILPLLADLGSDSPERREGAAAGLEALGSPALPHLRPLVRHPDPEVRRRARALVERLELARESQELLAARRYDFSFESCSLEKAVEELAARTGLPVKLAKDAAQARLPLLTLSLKKATCWEALARLRRKARLREVEPAPDEPQEVIRLAPGRERGVATALQGRVRFRASPLDASWPRFPGKDLVRTLELEVRLDPEMSLLGLEGIRIEDAREEGGRPVAVSEAILPGEGPDPALDGPLSELQWLVRDTALRAPAAPVRRHLVVRAGKTACRKLARLRGAAVLKVRTQRQLLATVDAPREAVGRRRPLEGGGTLTVTAVKPEPDGIWIVEATVAEGDEAGRMQPWQVDLKNVGGGTLLSARGEGCPFTLLDQKGQPIRLATGVVSVAGRGETRIYRLTYLTRSDEEQPARLTYSGPRATLIKVPFDLRDVPLE